MVEISEKDLRRFEEEFNRLRSEVYVFRAVMGAILANALESRGSAQSFFDDMRAQVQTGLTRVHDREMTPQKLRESQMTTANEFFDQVAEHLELAQTSEGRSGTH